MQTLIITSLSTWLLALCHADPCCRSAVGRVEWNITGYDRRNKGYLSELLICASVLFSRQLAMTVAFGFGKPRLGVSGDLQAALELSNLRIHPMRTRSWTITLLANSGLVSRVVGWVYRLSQGAETRKKLLVSFHTKSRIALSAG